MKNRKYKMCSGLAFADQEDMEMLHDYALQGWIFRELRFGVLYELHKEEPKDLIFSYDMQKVKDEEKEEYLAFFEKSGWTPISKWDKETHFFVAKNGTVPVHSEVETRNEQYRPVFITSLITFLTGVILLGIIYFLVKEFKIDLTLFAALAGGCIGGGGMLMIGSYLRVKGKRLRLTAHSYGYQFMKFLAGSIILWMFLKAGFGDLNFIELFEITVILWLILSSIYGTYRAYLYKHKKARKQND